jgi:hypothetical protein
MLAGVGVAAQKLSLHPTLPESESALTSSGDLCVRECLRSIKCKILNFLFLNSPCKTKHTAKLEQIEHS